MKRVVIGAIRIYQQWISPLFVASCRYHPTCSMYMLQAVQQYGVCRGVWLGVRRIITCHPYSKGGVSQVGEIYGTH